MTPEQIQANTDASYSLQRLIGFAQSDKLSATDLQIKECLLGIFNQHITEIDFTYSRTINNWLSADKHDRLHSVRIENKAKMFGGYITMIEVK